MKNDTCSAEWDVWERLREWRPLWTAHGDAGCFMSNEENRHAACMRHVLRVLSPVYAPVTTPALVLCVRDGANPIGPIHAILDAILDATYGTVC